MRNLRRNQTPMQFATYLGSAPIYQTDENEEIQYFTDTEGNRYPMKTGQYEGIYGNVEEIKANISLSNEEGNATEYGMSNADFSAILVLETNYPVKKGDYIWVKSPVQYKYGGKETEFTLKNGETIIAKAAVVESADYQVVGEPDSLNVGRMLLKSVNK